METIYNLRNKVSKLHDEIAMANVFSEKQEDLLDAACTKMVEVLNILRELESLTDES